MSGLNIVGSKRSDGTNREENDYYATDTRAIQDLCKFEDVYGVVWENAVGEGNLFYEIEKLPNVKRVVGTDLIDRANGKFKCVDFLKHDENLTNKKVDWIITNPPYKFGKEWAQKSINSVKEDGKVALLMKLVWLESLDRYKMFKNLPLKAVYVYSKRLGVYKNNIKTKNSGLVAYAWFVFDKQHKGNAIIDWII